MDFYIFCGKTPPVNDCLSNQGHRSNLDAVWRHPDLFGTSYNDSMDWNGRHAPLFLLFLIGRQIRRNSLHHQQMDRIYNCRYFTGSVSGLYDKFLIRNFDRMAVQAWSSIYQVGLLLPVILFLWYPKRKENTKFEWRWSIPMIGLFLVIADFLYFYAISFDGSLISVISALRRSGVIISFTLGGILFHEKNIRQKGWLLVGILAGVMILLFGS